MMMMRDDDDADDDEAFGWLVTFDAVCKIELPGEQDQCREKDRVQTQGQKWTDRRRVQSKTSFRVSGSNSSRESANEKLR